MNNSITRVQQIVHNKKQPDPYLNLKESKKQNIAMNYIIPTQSNLLSEIFLAFFKDTIHLG